MADHAASCTACHDKDIEITALRRVMGKLKRGIDGFTWVGHEMGLRRKIEEMERVLELASRGARVRIERLRRKYGAATPRLNTDACTPNGSAEASSDTAPSSPSSTPTPSSGSSTGISLG